MDKWVRFILDIKKKNKTNNPKILLNQIKGMRYENYLWDCTVFKYIAFLDLSKIYIYIVQKELSLSLHFSN